MRRYIVLILGLDWSMQVLVFGSFTKAESKFFKKQSVEDDSLLVGNQ